MNNEHEKCDVNPKVPPTPLQQWKTDLRETRPLHTHRTDKAVAQRRPLNSNILAELRPRPLEAEEKGRKKQRKRLQKKNKS